MSDRNIDRDCDSHKDVTVIRKLQADSDWQWSQKSQNANDTDVHSNRESDINRESDKEVKWKWYRQLLKQKQCQSK